jgi:hypothetical protein
MAEETRTIPKQSGMGAIPNAKGVTLREWAPHAEKVYHRHYPQRYAYHE